MDKNKSKYSVIFNLDKGIDNQNSNVIQHTSSRGKADPSSMMLGIHFVLDPLRHKLTDLRIQTWTLARTQPITSE